MTQLAQFGGVVLAAVITLSQSASAGRAQPLKPAPPTPLGILEDTLVRLIHERDHQTRDHLSAMNRLGGIPEQAALDKCQKQTNAVETKQKELAKSMKEFREKATNVADLIVKIDEAPQAQKAARTAEAVAAITAIGLRVEPQRQALQRGGAKTVTDTDVLKSFLSLLTKEVEQEQALLDELDDMLTPLKKRGDEMKAALAKEAAFQQERVRFGTAISTVEKGINQLREK